MQFCSAVVDTVLTNKKTRPTKVMQTFLHLKWDNLLYAAESKIVQHKHDHLILPQFINYLWKLWENKDYNLSRLKAKYLHRIGT